MTRKQMLARMRVVLQRRRDALRRTLAGELTCFQTTDERMVGDTIDEALDTDYGTINAELAERESRELAAVEKALERFEQGLYGICEECGGKIPMARLQALPYVTTCIACQRTSEQSERRVLGSLSDVPSDSESSGWERGADDLASSFHH